MFEKMIQNQLNQLIGICTPTMSNLANYSPYNKTYKFLLFQNQAYHEKNKRTMKPCVRTNLRYNQSQTHSDSIFNPEASSPLLRSSSGMKRPVTSSTGQCQSQKQSMVRSMFMSNKTMRGSSPQIDKPRRVIHKHESFQKFNTKKIVMENSQLVGRLVNTKCEIIKNEKSSSSFKNHLKYREIRNKYTSQGKRKQCLALGNRSLLCPTLKGYNQSGLGEKFLQLDLSMASNTSSPINSRKRNSNFSVQ